MRNNKNNFYMIQSKNNSNTYLVSSSNQDTAYLTFYNKVLSLKYNIDSRFDLISDESMFIMLGYSVNVSKK